FTPSPALEGVYVIRQMDSLVEIGTAWEKVLPRDEFWKKYDAGEFGEPRAFRTAGFDQWIKDVQAMPAEKQLEAVSRKLVELNPGFDGKMSRPFHDGPPLVEDGNVVEARILADKVSDLSPIRALSNLRQLECWATANTGTPLDLSPLMGMRIRVFKSFGFH